MSNIPVVKAALLDDVEAKKQTSMSSIPIVKAACLDGVEAVPPSPATGRSQGTTNPLTEAQIQQLIAQGYTRSLAESINLTKNAFGLRIWVVDNSGSMQEADGHRFIGNTSNKSGGGNLKMVKCTRWDEIHECVEYHIRLASLVDAPTRFRLLNHPLGTMGPPSFSIAEDHLVDPVDEVQQAVSLMRNTSPSGFTPLTRHITDIRREVQAMTPQLRKTGQRVAIIIATDGLPTDDRGYGDKAYQEEFVESLRRLEGLPVWVVIRLCTDDEDVVDFYNGLDEMFELSIDVLDDFLGEAKQMYDCNPWLTYSLPLHRMREMGYHDRLFDLIDERRLTASEMRDFCVFLLGADVFDGAPDPSVDWKGFVKVVERALRTTELHWNPVKNKAKPLVSTKKLNRYYGHASCF